MDNIGGAEIVSLTLARELKGHLYSTNVDYDQIKKMGFGDVEVRSIGKVPINAPFRQQAALWRFRNLNLKNKYDLFIISGDWAMSGAVKNKPNLWYVHSPIREIWDLYEYTRKNTVPFYARPAFDLWVSANRIFNKKYVDHVNKIVCNSKNTQARVKKFLNRDSTVIYPPIHTNKFHYNKNGDYWLSVNRLIGHKNVDVQLRAFSQLPHEKLIIVGSYEKSRHFKQYARYIQSIKPKNVTLLHWVDARKLIELYAHCKGFITTSIDEDFGMTAVEAMASGKLVIAPNSGGYRETVLNGKTGWLIDDMNVEKLVRLIQEGIRDPASYKKASIAQAQKFDVQVFLDQVIENIKELSPPHFGSQLSGGGFDLKYEKSV